MKLIIDIPEKTIAHIRSNYGHGYKGVYDEDRDIIATAIYTGKPYENMHGEWTFYDEEFYPQCRFASAVHHRIRECSICHHKIADFDGNMNFCPNCGCSMKGG